MSTAHSHRLPRIRQCLHNRRIVSGCSDVDGALTQAAAHLSISGTAGTARLAAATSTARSRRLTSSTVLTSTAVAARLAAAKSMARSLLQRQALTSARQRSLHALPDRQPAMAVVGCSRPAAAGSHNQQPAAGWRLFVLLQCKKALFFQIDAVAFLLNRCRVRGTGARLALRRPLLPPAHPPLYRFSCAWQRRSRLGAPQWRARCCLRHRLSRRAAQR